MTQARNAADPILLAEGDPPGAAGRSRSLTATNPTLVIDQVEDISTLPPGANLRVVPSWAAFSNRLPNAWLSCGARAPQRLRPRLPARRLLQPVVSQPPD